MTASKTVCSRDKKVWYFGKYFWQVKALLCDILRHVILIFRNLKIKLYFCINFVRPFCSILFIYFHIGTHSYQRICKGIYCKLTKCVLYYTSTCFIFPLSEEGHHWVEIASKYTLQFIAILFQFMIVFVHSQL